MSTARKKLNSKTETEILVSSRRRCAICFGLDRDADPKKGQIAHIDKDSSNDAFDNLAFLCLDHHDAYDSQTSQAKSFRPKELKHYRDELYNYNEPTSGNTLEDLTKAVLMELSLIPHEWKNNYMGLYPGHFADGTYERNRDYTDVWEMMSDVADHSFSKEEWLRYRPLFTVGINQVVDRIDRTVTAYGGGIPDSIKLVALRATSALRFEARTYDLVLVLVNSNPDMADLFSRSFRNVLAILSDVSRSASKERDEMSGTT